MPTAQRPRIVTLARYTTTIDALIAAGAPFTQIEAWILRLRIPADSREVLLLYATAKL